MFGIDLVEILNFFKQAGLAVAGAASFWGLILFIRSKKRQGEERESLFQVSLKMFIPLAIGIVTAVAAWGALSFQPQIVSAHAGIVIHPTIEAAAKGFTISSYLFIWLIVLSLITFYFYKYKKEILFKNLNWFYGILFISILVLISLPVWTGQWGNDQAFFIGHNFHSIFTLGTVLLLDFIFFTIKDSEKLQRVIYPFLPNLSKVIWVGLGFDFLSAWAIFDRANFSEARFFFAQTLIAVLIINGALLSGPINKKLISLVKQGGVKALSKRWNVVAGLCGIVSAVSWIAITFVDFIRGLTLEYPTLMIIYLAAIALIFAGYYVIEVKKMEEQTPAASV